MINVLILSDVGLHREGLRRILAGEEGMVVVGAVSAADEAAELLTRRPADVLLLDVSTPGAQELARLLRGRLPQLKTVAVGMRDERDAVLACAEAGITGYVCRDGTVEDLVESIRCTAAGELLCSRKIAGALIERLAVLAGTVARATPASPLTPRQAQIVRLVDDGLTNKQIAMRLGISTATARNHVHSILEKLGASTRSGAAAVARRTLCGR